MSLKENNTPINQNKKCKIKEHRAGFRLIGRIFSNGAMLSVSDKYDSVNKHIQEISEMKLHVQGVWQNAHKFIRQLAHGDNAGVCRQAVGLSLTMVLKSTVLMTRTYTSHWKLISCWFTALVKVQVLEF